MKVSDRQWQVGDKLKVTEVGYMLTGVECTVYETDGACGSVRVGWGSDSRQWLPSCREVELVEFKLPPVTEPVTIEQQAARLAEVYQKAFAAVDATLPERMWKASDPANVRQVAHDIAMLLVGQALKGETNG